MTRRPGEEPLLNEGLAMCVALPVHGMATLAQLWCWQLQAAVEIASLSLAPWQAAMKTGPEGASLFERATTQSLFDLAFCLGAAGEQRPFPD